MYCSLASQSSLPGGSLGTTSVKTDVKPDHLGDLCLLNVKVTVFFATKLAVQHAHFGHNLRQLLQEKGLESIQQLLYTRQKIKVRWIVLLSVGVSIDIGRFCFRIKVISYLSVLNDCCYLSSIFAPLLGGTYCLECHSTWWLFASFFFFFFKLRRTPQNFFFFHSSLQNPQFCIVCDVTESQRR